MQSKYPKPRSSLLIEYHHSSEVLASVSNCTASHIRALLVLFYHPRTMSSPSGLAKPPGRSSPNPRSIWTGGGERGGPCRSVFSVDGRWPAASSAEIDQMQRPSCGFFLAGLFSYTIHRIFTQPAPWDILLPIMSRQLSDSAGDLSSTERGPTWPHPFALTNEQALHPRRRVSNLFLCTHCRRLTF